MEIYPVCSHSFRANTYLITSGMHALLVDPTVSLDAATGAAVEHGTNIEAIVLTHGHFDHTATIDKIRDALKIPAYIHSHDAIMLTDGKKNAYFDLFGRECTHRAAELMLSDGDTIPLGNELLRVIHTPGHTGGCICLLGDDFLVTGDTLFADSIGRTDLWSADMNDMLASLEKLRKLPPTLKIYPGHGVPSTLGAALDNAAYFL